MPKDRYNQQQLLPNFANQRTSDYLLTPEHKGTKKSLTPQPTHPRNNSRASSHGSKRSHDPPPDQFRENSLNVYLHDVQHLVRKNIVGLPGNLSQLFENILQQNYFRRLHKVWQPSAHISRESWLFISLWRGSIDTSEILHLCCS